MKVSEIIEKAIGEATDGGCMLANYRDILAVYIDGERVDFDVQVHGNTKLSVIPLFCAGPINDQK